LLFASVVNNAASLPVSTHAAIWIPSVNLFGHLPSMDVLSEPARLLFLGVGFVVLGRQVRRKSR
jgi:hypothetical protein